MLPNKRDRDNDVGRHSNYTKYFSKRNIDRTGSLVGTQMLNQQSDQILQYAASQNSHKAYSVINSVNTAM